MNISEIITKLVQFNKTERKVLVKIYTRDENGYVIDTRSYPVESVFSHNEKNAEIIIEQANMLDV